MRPSAALLAIAAAAAASPDPAPLLGFTPAASTRERAIESKLLALASPERCEIHHRELTRTPHTSGTEGAARVAEYVAARFREYGLQTEVVSYDVLLSWPRSVVAEMTAPQRVMLGSREDVRPEDPQSGDPALTGPWHAYAQSGEREAEVVYVNHGRPEDYETLARMRIDVRGKIALARHFKGYRGGKSLEAERRGVAALVTYSDPAEDGYVQGDVYPDGPWGPDSHVQRGANVYDFIVPGDPLTPGWASLPGARRIAESESRILPRIPSLPLCFRDARRLLEALEGPERPDRDWQGGGPFAYHVGPGPARLRLALDIPRETKTIRNVIARIRGGDADPEVARQIVLLSNHHDAWTFGGVDPSSGTATALELARALGELLKQGIRPRRSVVFGIWDAEEFTLTGSTEWGEQHRDELARDAVVCLNVDSSTQGDRLSVGAVPSLRPFVYEAARSIPDPRGRGSLYDVWKSQSGSIGPGGYGVPAGESGEDPPVLILGSGSDYTVFFNHIGVPSLDMTFDGAYGVYHSIYDSHAWMRRFGDPGFIYHAAMAQLWGLMALRLANAETLPLDYGVYGRDILRYLDEIDGVARKQGSTLDLGEVRRQAHALASLKPPEPVPQRGRATAANRDLIQAERELTAAGGIPERPWFRHLIYAPLPSYAAETLPGIREALAAGDGTRAQAQAGILAAALERAVRRLGAAAGGRPTGGAR